MLEIDAKKFRDLMRAMCKLYGQEADEVLFDAYWLALRDWPFDAFEQAAGHLMASSKFMPRPADFNELRKASRPTSAEAWLKALAGIKSAYTPNGYYGGTSGDPLIDSAIRCLGGYAAIGNCDEEKLHWLEKRFSEIYENMQEAEDVRESVPMIAGPRQITRIEGPRRAGDFLPKLLQQVGIEE